MTLEESYALNRCLEHASRFKALETTEQLIFKEGMNIEQDHYHREALWVATLYSEVNRLSRKEPEPPMLAPGQRHLSACIKSMASLKDPGFTWPSPARRFLHSVCL